MPLYQFFIPLAVVAAPANVQSSRLMKPASPSQSTMNSSTPSSVATGVVPDSVLQTPVFEVTSQPEVKPDGTAPTNAEAPKFPVKTSPSVPAILPPEITGVMNPAGIG